MCRYVSTLLTVMQVHSSFEGGLCFPDSIDYFKVCTLTLRLLPVLMLNFNYLEGWMGYLRALISTTNIIAFL